MYCDLCMTPLKIVKNSEILAESGILAPKKLCLERFWGTFLFSNNLTIKILKLIVYLLLIDLFI